MSSTRRQEGEVDDMEIDEALPPSISPSRSPSPPDKELCPSRPPTPLSVVNLSRQFGRQTLENHTLQHRDTSSSQSTLPTASNSRRRATTPQDYFSLVRQQRQMASRYQCSTSHRLRVSQLVERMLQEDDAGANMHYNLISKATEEETTTPLPDASTSKPSASNLSESNSSTSNLFGTSYPCSSPLTTSPSVEDPESDPPLMWRTSQQSAFGVPYIRSTDTAAPRRRNAVEKPVRMRRRPGGKGQRHKTS
ncbi:hypothetical protein MMC30_003102 [Trapelia coarctata]|nr:hypothetical protein [Trapelia coarctata]